MNVLEQLTKINGYHYEWNETMEALTGQTGSEYGVIAQEVRDVFPDIIDQHPDGSLMVDYKQFVPILIEAVKELKQEIATLKGES